MQWEPITQLHLKFLGAFDLYISNMLSHTMYTHTCLPSLKFKCSQVPEVLSRRLFTTSMHVNVRSMSVLQILNFMQFNMQQHLTQLKSSEKKHYSNVTQ